MLLEHSVIKWSIRVTNWTEIAQTIQTALGLTTPPIAVTFTDAVPAGSASPQSPAPAGCSFWEMGAYARLATTAVHHQHCAIGVHTHNLTDAPASQQRELETALVAMQGLDYVRPDEVARLPVMSASSRYVLYGPLRDVTQAPSLALLFASASQGLIITEALGRVDGEMPAAMGRPACALIPQVLNSTRSASSLGCCGARAYLDSLSEDVTLWALHGEKLEAYTKEIVTLSRANSVLRQFHQNRRAAVESGEAPTVKESLSTLE